MAVERNTNSAMVNSMSKYLFKLGFFLLLLFFGRVGFSQVLLQEEESIEEIMRIYKRSNFDTPMVRAWRIQIVTTNDRATMEKAIEKFKRSYPEIKYSWQHNPPYYQVRIGAYEKKRDLEAFLLKLKEAFPAALPIQDDIEKTKIIYN